ncbi:FhaA domain-containing protein [Arthrobacter castelli]|uniref:FhaA domain-containing protein n=1 Tax=Arthrobacter castelli TaxID=271431 RepID=UPI0004220320|nr:DUF3662 and FHA domain-containing protein [Arthrobacter castelli]
MGLLDNVERGIERVVRGAFSHGAKAEVQPVEIASRLRRELDNKAMTVDAGRTLAPNIFDTRLSGPDFERAQEWGSSLAEELCDVVIRHVNSQNYTVQGPVRVSFTRDTDLKAGVFEIKSRTEKSGGSPAQSAPRQQRPNAPARQPTQLQPVLDMNGQRYSLNAASIILGRSSEADIMVDDTGVSRQHLEIRSESGRTRAVDLGSTNGSYVNGQRIDGEVDLTDGATISMGRTKLRFRLLPARSGGRG